LKRRDSVYWPGRSRMWLKIKIRQDPLKLLELQIADRDRLQKEIGIL
jgi:ATP-dependent DNA ligase